MPHSLSAITTFTPSPRIERSSAALYADRSAGDSFTTVNGLVPAIPRTISSMSWMYERLPTTSSSVPACS